MQLIICFRRHSRRISYLENVNCNRNCIAYLDDVRNWKHPRSCQDVQTVQVCRALSFRSLERSGRLWDWKRSRSEYKYKAHRQVLSLLRPTWWNVNQFPNKYSFLWWTFVFFHLKRALVRVANLGWLEFMQGQECVLYLTQRWLNCNLTKVIFLFRSYL